MSVLLIRSGNCKCTNMFHSRERMSSLSPLTTSSAIIVVPSSSSNGTPACFTYCSTAPQLIKHFLRVSDGTTIFCKIDGSCCKS
nr:hypothetical protein Iba_chr14bCG2290 [Ipomoea batatas]